SSAFLSSNTLHNRKASALLNRLPADSASRPITSSSIARLTSTSLRLSASLFFMARIRSHDSSIVSSWARFLVAACDRLDVGLALGLDAGLALGLRIFNRNLGSFKLPPSYSIFIS